jgi:glycolate oxidase
MTPGRATLADTLVGDLERVLPAGCLQVDPGVLAAYAQDRASFEAPGSAAVLVVPRSTADVAATLEVASRHAAPVVARGGGSGLTGAANAIDGCILLSLHRMDRVLEIDTTNRLARVQPGVINAELKRQVAAHGLAYPPDPASFEISSIGGNVATNAGGLCCVKYGVTRDYVVGLEVVLASGEVVRTGRHTLKRTVGLDLTGLFVGSEGRLGVITEVTVRLIPAPGPPATAVASFDDLPGVGTAVSRVFAEGHQPSLMEVVDRVALGHVERAFRMGLDHDAACLLIIQTEDDDGGRSIGEIARICEESGATFVHHATDPDEGALLVEARRRVWSALERDGRMLLPEDVAVPRERLPELLAGITDIADRRDVDVATIGHAGDGNLHPIFLFDPGDPDELARAKSAFEDILDLSLRLGGTIAAEHGIGTLKRDHVAKELDPVQLAVQRRIKVALDPAGILNPGKTILG